jgi:hypothetical protein
VARDKGEARASKPLEWWSLWIEDGWLVLLDIMWVIDRVKSFGSPPKELGGRLE